MAVRQYIGARYVPKFYENSLGTSEWQAGVAYEPLTIVTYNGNSYTSKKTVPANIGNPSANTFYWVATGLFNEQLNELQNDVNSIHDEIDGLTEDLSAVLNPKNFILIADSYGGRQDSGGDYLLDKIATLLQVNSYVASWKNGIGFTNVNSQGTFLEQLQTVTVTDNDAITDIMVVGGANDFGENISDIEAAISTFMSYVRTNYPKAKVTIAHVGCSRNTRVAVDKRSKYSILAYRKCGLYGARYLNNTEFTLHSFDLLDPDGVHPTAAGVAAIETAVVEAYTGGCANIRFSQEIAPTFNTTQTLYSNPSIADNTGFIQVEIDNGETNFAFKGGRVLEMNVSGGTITNGLVRLFDLNHKLVVGTTTAQYCIVCMAQALGSGDSILGTFPCMLYIDDEGGLSIFNRAAFIANNSSVLKIRIALLGSVTIPTIDC